MGAKLAKSLPISGKINGQEKKVSIINSNNHIDGTTILEKKNQNKKKPRLSNKKSLDTKVDKFTSTDGNGISSSSSIYIKQLVNGSAYNLHSYEASTNLTNHSGTPSKDVLELRDACIRRGIISPETNNVILPTSIEQDQQENTVEESINNEPTTTTTVVTNNEEVPIES